MIDEIFGALRGLASIGVVQSADDSGEAQTVTVVTADGVVRADVEVMQVFGFASLAPVNGAICLLLAVGGDPANLRALPVATPAARFGALAAGESVIYAQDGTRVHIRQGGIVDIVAGASVTVTAPAMTLSGNLTVAGDVVAGPGAISLIHHTHPDAQGGETGAPTG